MIIDSFVSGAIDRAVLVYPRFVSTLTQRPEVVQLLPIEPPEATRPQQRQRLDYIFEPDPQSILEELLPRYVEVQIYQAILETAASFFSAQMVAMRNATDNANDLVQSLSLTYNKVRQANITREVTEIASAAEAMAASIAAANVDPGRAHDTHRRTSSDHNHAAAGHGPHRPDHRPGRRRAVPPRAPARDLLRAPGRPQRHRVAPAMRRQTATAPR